MGPGVKLHLKVLTIGLLLMSGCVNEPKTSAPEHDLRPGDDTIVNMNRQAVKDENQEIEDFIERHHWKMETSPTGLKYCVFTTGSGKRPRRGELVTIRYALCLLNGDVVCPPGMKKDFSLRHSKVESGLEEGIMMMRKGDRARFIIPSHLAFGLLGDMNKIPPRATLVYDLELKNISEPK